MENTRATVSKADGGDKVAANGANGGKKAEADGGNQDGGNKVEVAVEAVVEGAVGGKKVEVDVLDIDFGEASDGDFEEDNGDVEAFFLHAHMTYVHDYNFRWGQYRDKIRRVSSNR